MKFYFYVYNLQILKKRTWDLNDKKGIFSALDVFPDGVCSFENIETCGLIEGLCVNNTFEGTDEYVPPVWSVLDSKYICKVALSYHSSSCRLWLMLNNVLISNSITLKYILL